MAILIDYKSNKNTSCIYKITNIINNKHYVGSTKALYFRIKKHINLLTNGKHTNKYLQRSWNKYGENNFKIEIVELCKEEDLRVREQYYLDNNFGHYNLAKDSISTLGYKWSEESKTNFSIKKRGIKFSDDHKKSLKENSFWKNKRGILHTRSKRVTQLTLEGNFIKEFGSIKEAERITKVRSKSISSACLGRYKTAGGFKWKHSI